MSKKQILFDQEGRRQLEQGVRKLSKAVRVTLGPGGRNVMLEKSFGSHTITKDGLTVAKEVELEHPFENMGAKLMSEAATRTHKDVGDGTTTSLVLTDALIREGNKFITAGVSPVALRNGIQKAVDLAVEKLGEIAQPVEGRKAIERVGYLSSNGDELLGKLFGEATHKVGTNGIVKVEENDGIETVLELVDGMEVDKGYISPYFITDVDEQAVVFENAHLLITDEKISSIRDLVPVLEQLVPTQKPLLIVAEDIEGEALAGLILNKLRGVLKVAAIKAPGFGDRRKAMLEDLAILTGGTFLSKDLGFQWEQVELSQLGRCKKLTIDKNATQFQKGAGSKEAVERRVQQIEKQIEQTSSNYDREKLEERRARLSGKIAIIKVGGLTEVEIKERKARAEDALNATRAAMEEGIVPGGGCAFIRVAEAVRDLKAPGDEKFGVKIVAEALSAPTYQLGENAGLDGAALVAEIEDREGDEGFDLRRETFVDLFKAGIVDPLKVVRSALQNAASIATLNLVSDAMITELPKDEEAVDGALT